jgi:hypothetical protein
MAAPARRPDPRLDRGLLLPEPGDRATLEQRRLEIGTDPP